MLLSHRYVRVQSVVRDSWFLSETTSKFVNQKGFCQLQNLQKLTRLWRNTPCTHTHMHHQFRSYNCVDTLICSKDSTRVWWIVGPVWSCDVNELGNVYKICILFASSIEWAELVCERIAAQIGLPPFRLDVRHSFVRSWWRPMSLKCPAVRCCWLIDWFCYNY